MRLIEDMIGTYTWVDFPGDWAGLYYVGKLIWEGHPGDFEWAYHLNMHEQNGTLDHGHAPGFLKEVM